MRQEILKIVETCALDVAEEQAIALRDTPDVNTVLFGESGIFDSMALVSLIVAVEQEVQDTLGVSIALADERALSQANSPYRTVGALADYAAGQLVQRGDDG